MKFIVLRGGGLFFIFLIVGLIRFWIGVEADWIGVGVDCDIRSTRDEFINGVEIFGVRRWWSDWFWSRFRLRLGRCGRCWRISRKSGVNFFGVGLANGGDDIAKTNLLKVLDSFE